MLENRVYENMKGIRPCFCQYNVWCRLCCTRTIYAFTDDPCWELQPSNWLVIQVSIIPTSVASNVAQCKPTDLHANLQTKLYPVQRLQGLRFMASNLLGLVARGTPRQRLGMAAEVGVAVLSYREVKPCNLSSCAMNVIPNYLLSLLLEFLDGKRRACAGTVGAAGNSMGGWGSGHGLGCGAQGVGRLRGDCEVQGTCSLRVRPGVVWIGRSLLQAALKQELAQEATRLHYAEPKHSMAQAFGVLLVPHGGRGVSRT